MKSRRRRRKTNRFEATRASAVRRTRMGRRLGLRYWVRFVPLVVLGLIAAAVAWVLLDNRFYVYDAEVVGTVRVKPDEVFWASDLPGTHILWVRANRIEAQIVAALPSLESAEVACRLPANCTLTVVERQSRMMWNDKEVLWWIDADGVIFAARDTASAGAESWVVQGPLPLDDEGLLEEPVRVALAELWASGLEIDQVLQYVPERGLVIKDARGWRVIVGQGSGIDRRLRTLEAVAAHLEAQGVTPAFVDVRFPDAPYYSLTVPAQHMWEDW